MSALPTTFVALGYFPKRLMARPLAEEIPVNRFCLIDSPETATETALRCGFERDGVEPGPYYLFEFWRRVE